MNLKCFLLFYVCFCVLNNSLAWKIFWKGRKRNGNLGEPAKLLTITAEPLPADQWFIQNLDHFDPTNNGTWMQRYYVNNTYFTKGGPVFLMIGGEGEATAKWMVQGAWVKYAQEFGALLFQLEHRFYGKSHPTKDLSVDNLKYLSSEQALADIAFFITAMNKQYKFSEDVKWIAFGGSYPGSLAAWVREKYPHLVHGSVSSSGPLLAKVDFTEYYDVVTQSLATYSDNCVQAVKCGMDQVEILLKHMIGQKSLNEKFKLCDPVEKSIDNSLDIANLFESLASNFAGVVQYNKDNSPHATVTIDEVCDIMTNTTIGAPVARLAEVNKLLLNVSKEKCLDYKYDKMIEEMKNVSWDSETAEGGRQWTYQTCTEFGFYQTSENQSTIFGNRFSVDFFIKQCADIFSKRFDNKYLDNSVQRTNTYYGALHPQTTNVIYVHGSIDPWHALGLISSKDPKLPTIYIQGTAHCANMYEPKKDDFPQLIKARQEIKAFIAKILK